MVPEELEVNNLGEKHKSFNKIVSKSLKTDEIQLDNFNADDSDVFNLIKIDIASAKRNLNYLLKVLVCDDLLYVSRVIKTCKWLITDNNYRHIINPQYLYSTLLIKMCTKGANKLMKNIQIHLKDEKRVEEFYEYETNPREAVKWLPHCSLEFIKNKITQHTDHLKLSELKRISARSISLLEIYINNSETYKKARALQATTFLVHTDPNKYLELLIDHHDSVKFSATETKSLLKNNSNQIINDYVHFDCCIHIPTFIKFLKPENIEDFLLNLSRKKKTRYGHLMNREHFQAFLEAMSKERRYEFIRKVFIEKIFTDESTSLKEVEKSSLKFLHDTLNLNDYFWYQYAPFEIAFDYLTKNIQNETYLGLKQSMFSVLIICAKKNELHIHRILEYFKKQNNNSSLDLKSHFLKELILQFPFHKFKNSTWELLQSIILSSDLKDSEEAQVLIRILITYKVINSQAIPITIENELKFDSFKMFKNKLNSAEKDLIITYLYNFIWKNKNEKYENEDKIIERIEKIRDTFTLLIDWDKDLKDYPLLLIEVKAIIESVGTNASYDINFLYNSKKSWRKYLFEDSLRLKLDKYTLINAIKHEPSLIKVYFKDTKSKQLTNVPAITQFLRITKIYFPISLTVDFRFDFMNDLHNTTNHINVTRGILALLSREEIIDILNKYAPKTAKVLDTDIDTGTLSLQRYFAKNMHQARPQPPPDVMLSYAKGDYLQYALPSLLSIFYNLNKIKSRIYIPQLLDSQVSLQKHGIKFAFQKLETHELTEIFGTMWKNNKNYTIRSVIFKVVFELLCKETDCSRKEDIWKLFVVLLDNLTLKEESNVYNLMIKIDKIPSEYRSKYYIKVYPFLEDLANSTDENKNTYLHSLYISFMPHAKDLMDELPSQFVSKMLLKQIKEKFDENKDVYWDYVIVPLVSAYLLCSKENNSQKQKHEEIFIPILKYSLSTWDEIEDAKFCKRNDLHKLLDRLCQDLPDFSFKREIIIPTELFVTILKELEDSFPVNENYKMLRKWKLTTTFLKAIEEKKSINWNDSCLEIADDFGRICISYLKEDCEAYFPYIYTLFSKALKFVLNTLVQKEVMYEIYKSMLLNKDFIEAYLVTLKLLSKYASDESLHEKHNELRNSILDHPSLEVKIHYHYKYK